MQSSQSRFRRAVARLLLAAFAATLPGSPALAEVVGEQVVSGEVAIDRAGDVTTIHASDGAIIQYDQFSIWADEQLHFVQPHAQARVMNRVLGDPTHIDGGLFANGIVYIVNPAGIFFGGSAVVDVGGLYAAAGNITNEDFAAGIDRFDLSGVVDNAGRIEAPEVALLGRVVANHGEIHAPEGTIALVAGERVLLTRLGGHLHVLVDGGAGGEGVAAIEQTGTVDAGPGGEVSFTTGDAYSLAVNHDGITRGGRIEVRAAQGLLEIAGLLDASDASEGGTGGDIAVTGERVALLGALLDASGDAGGGSIRVGGDLRGDGPLPNAKRTFVDEVSVLRADAATRGDGGSVIVYADEATAFHGALSARGGAEGGDGGFAEISGAVFLFSEGDVDLRAVQGANGTLLYDPKDIVIQGGVADGDDAPDVASDTLANASLGQVLFAEPDELASPFTIHESEIEGTQADVVLEATNSITTSGAGTFTNDAAGEGTDVLRIADGFSVTMRTRNLAGDETGGLPTQGIDLSDISIQTSGGGGITLETGVGDPTTSPATPGLGGDIIVADLTTRGGAGEEGGDVVLDVTGVGDIAVGAIDTRGGAAVAASGGAGGAVSLETQDGEIDVVSIDTRGGDTTSADPAHAGGAAGGVRLVAVDADASGDSHITVTGALLARGGAASTGSGGAGSLVIVSSDGDASDPVQGGGDVTVTGPVDASGGDGGVDGDGGDSGFVQIQSAAGAVSVAGPVGASGGDGAGGSGGNGANVEILSLDGDVVVGGLIDAHGGLGGPDGTGGNGGNVQLDSGDGAISAVAGIVTSGGDSGQDAGTAGGISVATQDADASGVGTNDNDVTLGALTAVGGTSTSARGGISGRVDIDTFRSEDDLGGGSITIDGPIDISGGDGGTFGGTAARVFITARGADKTLTVNGDITSSGGAGGDVANIDAANPDITNDGANGAPVRLRTEDGDITVAGGIDSRGGDAGTSTNGNQDALGGNGGTVRIEVLGFDDAGSGNVQLLGNVDASEGTHGVGAGASDPDDPLANRIVALQNRDGGSVFVEARGDLTHGGQAGPHITTTGNVTLLAEGDIGSVADPFTVLGSDERRLDAQTGTTYVDHDTLQVMAGDVARVQVLSGGRFRNTLDVGASSLDADVLVTQPAEGGGVGDRVEMIGDGSEVTVVRADTTVNEVNLIVRLESPDDMAPDGALVLANGSTTAGGQVIVASSGDIVVGDGVGASPAVTASAVAPLDAMPGEPLVGGIVGLDADLDRDGTGAIRDGGGVIDLLPAGADEPGSLTARASEGIGAAGAAITVRGGGDIALANTPLRAGEDDPNTPVDESFISDPYATSGIYLTNVDEGDLRVVGSPLSGAIVGVENVDGAGDIELRNDAGDLILERPVVNQPPEFEVDPDEDPTPPLPPIGNDVLLAAAPGGRIVLDTFFALGVDSRGRFILDGTTVLASSFFFQADGGLDALGTLDTDDAAESEFGFSGQVGDASSLQADVGATRALSFLTLGALDPDDPTPQLTFDLASVTTTQEQVYDVDTLVVGDVLLDAGDFVNIGALDADASAVTSSVTLRGGDFVQLMGNVGETRAPIALDVEADQVAFAGDGLQTVNVGTGGIRLGSDISSQPVSPVATIARLNDDLQLETTGELVVGDRHKLSVPGTLTLIGDRVRVTDLSAVDLDVQANTFEVYAREAGPVLLPGGAQTVDLGTDILANSVSFSTTPTVVGGGSAPRIATLDATATNSGSLQVTRLERAITASDITSQEAIFDLAIPVSDPGFETPELPADPVEVPLGVYPSEDASAPADAVSTPEVVAYLTCAPRDGQAPPGCAPRAKPPYGSPLDTERADEVAADWRWLVGGSKRAEAGRAALARTAAEPGTPLADTSPAGRSYLARAARLLARTRMLGLGAERYAEVREDLLAGLVAAIGTPEVDGERLRAGIEAYAMGMEI